MSPPAGPGDRSFRVLIDQARLAEDLAHNTPAARAAGQAAAEHLKRNGALRSQLRRCQAEDRAGVALPGCVKTYVPDVNGASGIVLALRADDRGEVYLEFLAFGQRHPTRTSSPSVYQVAAARLRHL